MWQSIRDNPRAVTYAVLMHLVLLALLMVGLDWTPKSIKPGAKVPIQAELVTSDKLKAAEQKKQRKLEQEKQQLEEKRKAEADNKRKLEAEQQAAEKATVEKKKQSALAVKKKAEAEKKKQVEVAAKKKAAVEKKRIADAAAKKKVAVEKKRKEAEAARRREAEKALQAQLAEEEAQARAESALAEYIPYIQGKIQRNWLRPPGSPPGLTCLVKVRLIPGGDVVSVSVVRSSGDPLFDRSVETAVLKASPLPLPEDAKMFKYFREINFNFDPGR